MTLDGQTILQGAGEASLPRERLESSRTGGDIILPIPIMFKGIKNVDGVISWLYDRFLLFSIYNPQLGVWQTGSSTHGSTPTEITSVGGVLSSPLPSGDRRISRPGRLSRSSQIPPER